MTIGRLPLTPSMRQVVSLAETGTLGLFFLAIMTESAGLILARSTSGVDLLALAQTLMILGVVVAVAYVVAVLLGRLLPHGKVLDPPPGHSDLLVELRRVHPSFVTAVRQHQNRQTPTSPLAPGSK